MKWKNLSEENRKNKSKPDDCGELVDVELIRPSGQKMLKRSPNQVDWGNVKMWR